MQPQRFLLNELEFETKYYVYVLYRYKNNRESDVMFCPLYTCICQLYRPFVVFVVCLIAVQRYSYIYILYDSNTDRFFFLFLLQSIFHSLLFLIEINGVCN